MLYTLVPVTSLEPLTLGAEFIALDDPAGEAWKKALQQIHPRLVPQLKESALLAEEDSAFCVAGGVFDYQRGQELVFDGQELVLSHCAEHFMNFLMEPEECLRLVAEHRDQVAGHNVTEADENRLVTLCSWWERGDRVLFLQHV